jgi:hypothetical protein
MLGFQLQICSSLGDALCVRLLFFRVVASAGITGSPITLRKSPRYFWMLRDQMQWMKVWKSDDILSVQPQFPRTSSTPHA